MRNTDPDTHTNPDTHANANAYTNAYTNTHPYADAYSYTDADTGADHAARAWLQSARPANGGPLLEWADLGLHRHLSQRRVHCHRAERRWCLHRSHQPQWEGNLYVYGVHSGHWELLEPGHGKVWRRRVEWPCGP